MKKVLYVHYQKNASEGSIVHVRRFSASFGKICVEHGIEFRVLAPEVIFLSPGQEKGSFLGGVRRWMAKYYLRDLKVLLQQIRKSFQERAYLREYKPDIVLTRYDAETLSIHWACRVLKIPVVTEFNGRDRGELAGTYMDYKQLPIVNRLFSNRRALHYSAGAMAVSDPIAKDLRADNLENKPVIVNHNGVDLTEFDPDFSCDELRISLKIPEQAVVVGYIGSFIVWHAPDRLIRAFAALLATGVDAYLVLVGRKLPEIELMIKEAGEEIESRVRLTGFVAHENIPPYLALMNIAVLPNTQAYCSPLKLFEYMAMAKACLAPNTSTIQSIIKHGEEGLLFDPDSDKAFTNGLIRLAQDRNLCLSLGKAARSRVEHEFTWEHNAHRVMCLLQDALAWQQKNIT